MFEKNVLAIDYGDARIGLAISQAGIPTPYGFLKNDNSFFDNISRIIEEFDIQEIVIGTPSPQSQTGQKIKTFSSKVEKFFTGEVFMWDETLTSVEANEILIGQKISYERSKKLVDSLSAFLILKSYLESREIENSA